MKNDFTYYNRNAAGKYEQTYYTDDENTVFRRLSEEMICKKINACKWIYSIKRVQRYSGYTEIVVLYNHNKPGDGKGVYRVDLNC